MSVPPPDPPKIEFISGQELIPTPAERAASELRAANIFNFSVRELVNGATVIEFTGALEAQTTGIMNRNGFRPR